jgi:hypothetical protein
MKTGGATAESVLTGNDGAGKAVTAIKADTIAASRSVDFDLASVGLELLGGILGSDSALDSETSGGDTVLRKAELLEGRTCSDLDLSSDDVDAGNLLGDSVLDLDTGIDFDKVVSVLLVDEELCGACVAVVDGPGQLDSIGQDSVSNIGGKVLGRCNLDNLLMTALNGAITLVKVDNVAVVVTEKLNLNVLGLVKESLDEDSAVAKGRLGLRGSSLEVLLEGFGITDHTHTSTTSTVGGLDDDGEAVLVGEGFDLFESLDGALGTRNNRNISSDSQLSG